MSERSQRVEGIDVARGLASVLMIQGHAFDAWASPEARASAAYRWVQEAWLQTLALPAFFVVAGASFALRLEAARARGERASAVRAAIVRRGLTIVGVGYGLSAFSACLDGWEGPQTWLRADVLHAIGLSLVTLAAIGIRGGDGAWRSRWLAGALAVLATVPVALCAPLSAWARNVSAACPLAWVLALVVDVPDVTRMPLVPLVSWTAIGAMLARAWTDANRGRAIEGAPRPWLLATAAVAIAVAIVGALATRAIVGALGGTLDRAHPAVIANAVDLGGRGVAVLALGASVTTMLPGALRGWLLRLGRGSLWAYVFHLPFCYGAFGEWLGLRGRLGVAACAVAAVVLVLASTSVVCLRDAVARVRADRASSRGRGGRSRPGSA